MEAYLKLGLCIAFSLFGLPKALSQDHFVFENNKTKVTLSFQLINNLIFIPLEINGKQLTFLVDSGVEETLLFSLNDNEELLLKNIETISFKGLGNTASIEGLKSSDNVLNFKNKLINKNHTLFIILDESFNISSSVGIPVNGIIGTNLFKNHLVKINYKSKTLTIQKHDDKYLKKLNKKHKKLPIQIIKGKPYLDTELSITNNTITGKWLLDIGNSDACWFFPIGLDKKILPKKNIDDYLGRGFSGEIFGKRALINQIKIENFTFTNPLIAFPDSTSLQNVTLVNNRKGSIGAEILKRFTLIFDYKNEHLYLSKNSFYNDSFIYDKSGLEFQQSGMQWVQERTMVNTLKPNNKAENTIYTSPFQYEFKLKPIYQIYAVRKNSPAEIAGLQKGDFVLSINSKSTTNMSLEKVNSYFKDEDGKKIILEIERKNVVKKIVLYLKDYLK